jgi:hypothetical protein
MKKLYSSLSTVTIAVGLSLFSAAISQAQSTWNGGATPNGNFSAANWSVAPTSGAGNTLNFDGSINLNATNDITLTSADQVINFNAGASAFTIYGGAIRAGNIANNSSVLQTILPSVRLNGGRTFNVGTAGLSLGSPVGSTSTSGRTVTKTGTGDLTIGNGTAVSGGAGYSVSQGALVFANTTATTLGSGAANGVSLTASGTTLRFNNSGTLSMLGAITTVSGSSVTLNNSAAVTVTGGTTIAAGANLTGAGNLGGGLISVSGGVAPGISGIGTITVANLTLASGSAVTMELDRSAGQNADLLSASGTLTFGGNGTLQVNNIGASLLAGDTFNLFDGTISGPFATVNLPSLDAGLVWDQSQLYTTGIIDVTAVPEPATFALLGIGGLVASWQIRRRKA